MGFSFYTPFARSLHGFCTVRIFRVRWSKSVNYFAIRAIFCNSGQQSQAKLRFYGRVCVFQKLQQCRHGDGRFCFNRGSLHKCCSPVRLSHHRRRSSVGKQSAGCAMESLNSTKACWSPDVKKTAKQIKSTLPFYSNSTSSCNSNSVELHIANCCFNVPLISCLAIKKARLLNALH